MPDRRRKASPVGAPFVAGLLVLMAVVAAAGRLAREEHPGRFLLAALHGGRFEGVGGVLQTAANDCGPAALAHCLRRLGVDAPYPDPDGGVVLTSRGCRLDALAEEAERKGRPSRLRRLSPDATDPERLQVPSILHVREGHFLVYEGRTEGGRIAVHDPALGSVSLSEVVFRRRWTGHVLDFPEGGIR